MRLRGPRREASIARQTNRLKNRLTKHARSHRVDQLGWARRSALLSLALLATIALFVGYCLLNPSTLIPLANALTERYLDRTLSIEGDVTLELSLHPVVTAREVRFSNAAWATAPDMASAEYVLVQIDIGALFDKHVHLLDLDLHKAELNLEDRVDGQPNWIFSDEDSDDNDWTFMLEGLNVVESVASAQIGELNPIQVSIPRLVESSDSEGHLNLQGNGSINDGEWLIQGRIGPFDELLIGGRIELALDMTLGDIDLGINGSIGNLAFLSELDLALTAYGPDADAIGKIFGMPDAFADDVALNATIQPAGNGHAMRVSGHVSQFLIDSSGTVADLHNLDGWDGNVSIRGPDLGAFGKALQITGFPDGPFQAEGGIHLHGGDLDLKEVRINAEGAELKLSVDFADFPHRRNAIGSLQVAGPDISQFAALLNLQTLPVLPFQLQIALDASGNEVLTSNLNVGSHSFAAAGPLGEFPDFHGTRLTATLSGDDVATLLNVFTDKLPFEGAYQAAGVLSVEADGLTLNETRIDSPTAHLSGSMHWDDPGKLGQFDLQAALKLNDLAETAKRLGFKGLPEAPLSVEATVRADAGHYTLVKSHATLETLEISANGLLGDFASYAGMDLQIDASGADMGQVFSSLPPTDEPADPFTLKTQIRTTKETIEIQGFTLHNTGGILQADGTYSLLPGLVGSSFTVEGEGPNLRHLLPDLPGYQPANQPWQIRAKLARPEPGHLRVDEGHLNIGSVNVALSGTLDTGDHSSTRMTIAASGDRISDVGQIGDVPWPDHPFDFTTELEGTPNLIHISQLTANWGESDLEGNGSLDMSDKPVLDIKGTSKLMNLIDLQHALFGEFDESSPPPDTGRVIPETVIPIEYLDILDITLDLEIAQFRGRRSNLQDVDLKLEVQDGALRLDRIAYQDDRGSFDAHGTLRPEGEGVYLEMTIEGDDADLGLFTNDEQLGETVPRYTLDVDVYGSGRTVAEIAGNLNGTALISSDGGQINNALLNAFTGDFLSNVLEVLNPFVKSEEFTNMECMVINAAMIDGMLDMSPGFVMRTNRVNMYVYGEVDLETEKLDLSLATQARRGIGISAASITNPYFKVGGSMIAPALQLDPASATIAASVATATAGLSILFRGLWDRLMGAQNPCPTFLEYERKTKQKPAPSPG